MLEDKIYTLEEMRSLGIDTHEYVFMDQPGEVTGTLVLKAESRTPSIRIFFALSDGRKILTPIFWWQLSRRFQSLILFFVQAQVDFIRSGFRFSHGCSFRFYRGLGFPQVVWNGIWDHFTMLAKKMPLMPFTPARHFQGGSDRYCFGHKSASKPFRWGCFGSVCSAATKRPV